MINIKVEAVTVSINYSDFLSECLDNKNLLDRWIIVTHEKDQNTINLCKKHQLEYVLSNRIYENGAPFAKGKAINEGLEKLEKDAWLLQLDSDILLSNNFRKIVERWLTDKNKLYWARRYCKDGTELWSKFVGTNKICTAIGFFQLWHSDIISEYFEESDDCVNDDLSMREYFIRNHNGLEELKKLRLLDVSGIEGKFHQGRRKINSLR